MGEFFKEIRISRLECGRLEYSRQIKASDTAKYRKQPGSVRSPDTFSTGKPKVTARISPVTGYMYSEQTIWMQQSQVSIYTMFATIVSLVIEKHVITA